MKADNVNAYTRGSQSYGYARQACSGRRQSYPKKNQSYAQKRQSYGQGRQAYNGKRRSYPKKNQSYARKGQLYLQGNQQYVFKPHSYAQKNHLHLINNAYQPSERLVDDAYIASCQKYFWGAAIVSAIGLLVSLALGFSLKRNMNFDHSRIYLFILGLASISTMLLYLPSLVLELRRFRSQPVRIHQRFIWAKSIMWLIVMIGSIIDVYIQFEKPYIGIVLLVLFLIGYPFIKLVFFYPKIGLPLLALLLLGMAVILVFLGTMIFIGGLIGGGHIWMRVMVTAVILIGGMVIGAIYSIVKWLYMEKVFEKNGLLPLCKVFPTIQNRTMP